MLRISISLTISFLIIIFAVHGQGLIVEEKVTFEISENYFHVSGFYTIAGKANENCVIKIPFPYDTAYYFPVDSVFISNTTFKRLITNKALYQQGVEFQALMDNNGMVNLHILFNQKLKKNQSNLKFF